MKLIKASNCNKRIIVDDSFFKEHGHYSWRINNTGYPVRTVRVDGKVKMLIMHQVVLPKKAGYCNDHINRNKLDNRRINLRYATPAQNLANKAPRCSSGYKGVRRAHGSKNWEASIIRSGRYFHLGTFPTKKLAALAYNKKSYELYGEFAFINKI